MYLLAAVDEAYLLLVVVVIIAFIIFNLPGKEE